MSLTPWRKLHGESFQGVRALVTGGAGFIGSHLTEALVELGAEVVALDDLSGGDAGNFDAFRAAAGRRLSFVKGSILDAPLVRDCVAGCRYVFHQAALGSVPRSVETPAHYFQVNVDGTMVVLEAARCQGVSRLMFAASAAGYGDSEALPKVEAMAPTPRSPYAAHKVAVEALLAAYAASYPLDAAALRYFNIYGPRQNANSAYAAVIAAFAKAFLAGKAPMIFGDGEQSRDFCYVENVVHANLLAARSPGRLGGRILNIACGMRVSVNQLAAQMGRMMGRGHLKPTFGPVRLGDVKHSLADISAAREALGYAPVVDFEAGLAETVRWYQQAASAAA